MAIKVSSTSKYSSDEKTYSGFGKYHLRDEIIFNLPNNTITLHDMGDGKFSYTRNSQNEVIRKIIQVTPEIHQIELAPVLPVHRPAYKTDFFFLRFEEPLFITERSTIETQVSFPIEIGMFLIAQKNPSGFDFFSCDPSNSRFGLYGTPEDGKICKYASISLDGEHIAPQPFINAQFRIKIRNELDESASVGKIVFPVTDHDLYYRVNDVTMDSLHAIVKNRVGLHIIETIQNPIRKPVDWDLASRDIEKTDYKFSMERGFD